jgi:hypothetical protein
VYNSKHVKAFEPDTGISQDSDDVLLSETFKTLIASKASKFTK